ncbi:MAG: O-acetylhomoserine aminocarboxypropyltransferase/cysteine synthase family protein [Halanaeroarchaeum sp.]
MSDDDRDPDRSGIATESVHAGQSVDPATKSRAPPIYQTSSYVFDDADHAARLFALEEPGNIYSRLGNPTNQMLEERIATLEGGSAAVATASGMAAFDTITFVLAEAGDNVVTAASIYGGTHTYLTHTASRRGIEARFVDTLDVEAYRDAVDEDTAFVHLETIGNPALVTPDIEAVADVAHEHDVPLVVDNTFATPVLSNPLDYGADIVWHSTTKWLTGSGSTIGGVIVDGGSFPWEDADYPEVAGANPAYHGVDFRERFGDAAFATVCRARGLRDLGNQQSPFDAWVTLQKLETLPLRVQKHSENAQVVAEYLEGHEAVSWVNYPGLESHETHEAASRYLDGGVESDASGPSADGTTAGGYGGMITFGLEGGYEAGRDLTEAVDLASLLANVGDAKTLIIHPASTTHQQLTDEEQAASGVTDDLVRLSVGIEDPADVVADLDRAIDEVTHA